MTASQRLIWKVQATATLVLMNTYVETCVTPRWLVTISRGFQELRRAGKAIRSLGSCGSPCSSIAQGVASPRRLPLYPFPSTDVKVVDHWYRIRSAARLLEARLSVCLNTTLRRFYRPVRRGTHCTARRRAQQRSGLLTYWCLLLVYQLCVLQVSNPYP